MTDKNANQNGNEHGVVLDQINDVEHVVICFKKDAQIRLKQGAFTSLASADVDSVSKILDAQKDIKVERLFDQTEETLNAQVAELNGHIDADLPSLSSFYSVYTKTKKQSKEICKALESHPDIDEVYIEPPAVPALFAEPAEMVTEEALLTSPDFVPNQGYLNPAPAGVDAKYAWTIAGGKGDKVQVIDIEGGWNFSHEDLLKNQGGVIHGTPTTNASWENHGTAVQGEISGDENQFGVVGIAPKAKFSAASIFGPGNSPAKAIKAAADKLNPGDIILIELHRAGPNANGQGQFGFIALEWWAADFAAVQYASAKGVIVIAAAGNGAQNLDDAVYQGRFDRNQRDSGAILVGAGAPPSGNFGPDRSRLGFSNYGTLIDAQGWGREVTTTGYGNLQGGSDKNKWYTDTFSGTSSASPIVVGAVASLQSIHKTHKGSLLNFSQIRNLLRTTGSPQTDGPNGAKTQRIGNRPNLNAAIAKILPQSSSGIATRYWARIQPTNPTLWLLVNNSWKRLDNADVEDLDLVQRSFLGSGSGVRVGFNNTNQIVWLATTGT